MTSTTTNIATSSNDVYTHISSRYASFAIFIGHIIRIGGVGGLIFDTREETIKFDVIPTKFPNIKHIENIIITLNSLDGESKLISGDAFVEYNITTDTITQDIKLNDVSGCGLDEWFGDRLWEFFAIIPVISNTARPPITE
jgi:hypothetical protein